MKKRIVCLLLVPILVPAFGLLSGCDTLPQSETSKANLSDSSQTALDRLEREDPDLKNLLDSAPGYAVFPSIDKAGIVAGGAYGCGQVYEHGAVTGFASMTQGSIGLQAGAQDYAELVVFGERSALDKFKEGKFELETNASAIIAKAGAAKTASYRDGVIVFAEPNNGAMVELSLSGQKFQYAATKPAAN